MGQIKPMTIDPIQSRAARELLGWTQARLAEAAAIHLSLVKNFECEYRENTAANRLVIRHAFEQAGVIFESSRNFVGAKAKLRRAAGYGMPVDAKQSRAARELLGWTQAQLAEAASIRLGSVRSFEGGQCETTEAKLLAISTAFEEAGIVFESDGELVGVKVKRRRDI
jgi:transcriptional regulator with XRE-family HTH domain